MQGSFRALALAIILLYGLAPQIACFASDQPLTTSEMDCCAKLASDCGQTNMSCCRTVTRTDEATFAQIVPNPAPLQVDITDWPARIASAVPAGVAGDRPTQSDHAPPYDFIASSIILRI